MIRIICLGKIKETYLTNLIDDYKKRISKYHKIEIVELKDENDLSKEAQNIIKYIGPKDYCIVCDLKGDNIDSEGFARLVDTAFLESGTIDFIIGSSDGIDESIKKRADKLVSFGNMTMPHGLFRGVLLEQLYRAFKINNNETYHK